MWRDFLCDMHDFIWVNICGSYKNTKQHSKTKFFTETQEPSSAVVSKSYVHKRQITNKQVIGKKHKKERLKKLMKTSHRNFNK